MNIDALILLLNVFCGADKGFLWYLVVGWVGLIWRPLLVLSCGNVFVCVLDRPVSAILCQSYESFDCLQLQGVHCTIEKFQHFGFHIITVKAPF